MWRIAVIFIAWQTNLEWLYFSWDKHIPSCNNNTWDSVILPLILVIKYLAGNYVPIVYAILNQPYTNISNVWRLLKTPDFSFRNQYLGTIHKCIVLYKSNCTIKYVNIVELLLPTFIIWGCSIIRVLDGHNLKGEGKHVLCMYKQNNWQYCYHAKPSSI